jgi:hypothetical protein
VEDEILEKLPSSVLARDSRGGGDVDIPRTPQRRRVRLPAAVALTLAMAFVVPAATRNLLRT